MGCSAPAGRTLTVHARSLPACTIDGAQLVQLEAFDDVAPGPDSFAEVRPDVAQDLRALPAGAQIFAARVRAGDGSLIGSGLLVREGDDATGALYPEGRACALGDASGTPAVVSPLAGATLAGSARHTLLVGGVGDDKGARSDLLVLDGVRGEVFRLGMRRRRSGAAVAIASAGALLAGGEADGSVWEDAEVLDLAVRPPSLAADTIALSEPRAHGAAVTLASGEVLLVGGARGASLVRTMEAVDLRARRTRTLDVGALALGRRDPLAVRVSTSEVFVLGGTDAAGAPVADIELFDGAARTGSRLPFPASAWVTASAQPAAMLVVTGTMGATSWEARLVRADGVITVLPAIDAGAGPPVLVAATDGAPFLWDGSLRRYDPWTGRFVATPVRAPSAPLPLGLDALAFATSDGGGGFSATRFGLRHHLSVDDTLGLGSIVHLVPNDIAVVATRAGVLLPAGARVALADTDYGAFQLRVGVGGFRELPVVELRTPLGALVARIAADGPCAYPLGEGDELQVDRAPDGTLTLQLGSSVTRCVAATDRVTVGFLAPGRDARIRGLTIRRVRA